MGVHKKRPRQEYATTFEGLIYCGCRKVLTMFFETNLLITNEKQITPTIIIAKNINSIL